MQVCEEADHGIQDSGLSAKAFLLVLVCFYNGLVLSCKSCRKRMNIRRDSISFVRDIDLCRERTGTLKFASCCSPFPLSFDGDSGESGSSW